MDYRRSVVLVLVLFLGSESPAAGGFYTGNQLREQCVQLDGSAPSALCMGYIAGVADSMDDPHGNDGLCISGRVTLGQVREVALRYMNSHADVLHMPARSLVAEALKIAFPCE